MPTFDFRCTRCGKTFEKRLALGVRTKPACPHCGSRSTEKLITPPAVHFRGSGFYKTDAAKPAKAEAPKKEGKTGSTPADAKPAKPSKASE